MTLILACIGGAFSGLAIVVAVVACVERSVVKDAAAINAQRKADQ